MRRNNWRSCGKKTRYETEHAASKEISKIDRSRPGQRLRYYDCAECGGFHLTKETFRPR